MRASVVVPVYNGARFLGEALDSILSQTFTDFELIICDNASTDDTESICQAYLERDKRLRYYRSAENIGAAGNWNRVFELSSGELFKWMADDDCHEPDFLARCVELLHAQAEIVVSFTQAVTIDSDGRRLREWGSSPAYCSDDVATRYGSWLAPAGDPLPLPIFGVMRSEVLRKTRLFAGYPESDIALLAELSLYGRFGEVDRPLFLQREHAGRAGPQLARDHYDASAAFWNARDARKPGAPHWALWSGMRAALEGAGLDGPARRRCGRVLNDWAWRNRGLLAADVALAGARLPGVGPGVDRAIRSIRMAGWRRRVRRLQRDLDRLIPASAILILVDDDSFGPNVGRGRTVRPFLEAEYGYAGPPLDDETAVRELERMRGEGARYLVFGWPCFWWLSYYHGFVEHLNNRFKRVLQNDRLIVFDLQQR